jgi:hypothetical protein
MKMDRTQKLDPVSLKKRNVPKVCSNCNKIYRIEPSEADPGLQTVVTLGLCKDCFDALNKQQQQEEENHHE